MSGPARTSTDPLEPLRSEGWLTEARRKAIHMGAIILPLGLLYEWLPWPRGKGQWRLLLLAVVAIAILIDLIRIHQRDVGEFFRRFFGEMIREHERFNLLGSTYLALAALLALEIFPRPITVAALGYTILGDATAALVGRGWGHRRIFNKTLEGGLGGLAACLVWAAFLGSLGYLPWTVLLVGALAASLVEILPIPLDDNLGVTLFGGYAMKVMTLA